MCIRDRHNQSSLRNDIKYTICRLESQNCKTHKNIFYSFLSCVERVLLSILVTNASDKLYFTNIM